MEAGLVGSLLRMYVQTKPFVPIMKRCEDLRIVPDVYEFEEIFSLKTDVNFSEYLKCLNKEKFEDTFEHNYMDQNSEKIAKGDILIFEVKRSVTPANFKKIYNEMRAKIKVLFTNLSTPFVRASLSWMQQ